MPDDQGVDRILIDTACGKIIAVEPGEYGVHLSLIEPVGSDGGRGRPPMRANLSPRAIRDLRVALVLAARRRSAREAAATLTDQELGEALDLWRRAQAPQATRQPDADA